MRINSLISDQVENLNKKMKEIIKVQFAEENLNYFEKENKTGELLKKKKGVERNNNLARYFQQDYDKLEEFSKIYGDVDIEIKPADEKEKGTYDYQLTIQFPDVNGKSQEEWLGRYPRSIDAISPTLETKHKDGQKQIEEITAKIANLQTEFSKEKDKKFIFFPTIDQKKLEQLGTEIKNLEEEKKRLEEENTKIWQAQNDICHKFARVICVLGLDQKIDTERPQVFRVLMELVEKELQVRKLDRLTEGESEILYQYQDLKRELEKIKKGW